jgi:putative phosphoribosyl transferase
MRAAVAAVRRRRPRRIVVAVPVGAAQTVAALAREVDLVLCPQQPPDFAAVGQAYDDFRATSDDDVQALLSAR